MGRRVRTVGVWVAAGTVVLGVAACAGPVAVTAAPPASPVAVAPATSAVAAPSTEAAAAPTELADAFPAAADPTCAPAGSGSAQLTTSTGVTAVDAVVCDHSSVAAGARIIYAQWPDAAAAQRWYQDTADLGPRIEQFDNWQVGGVVQGPLHTAQGGAFVYSTGIYQGLPYGWEIQTTTLDESNAVFEAAGPTFRPATELGG